MKDFSIIPKIALLGIVCIALGCSSSRLKKIQPGMSPTDVAIELGRPVNVRFEDSDTYWLYPSTEKEVCWIHFKDKKVTEESMTCESGEPVRQIASLASHHLHQMNSETAYKNRVTRFCGRKPNPPEGCHVSDECRNGGWELICPPSGKTKNDPEDLEEKELKDDRPIQNTSP